MTHQAPPLPASSGGDAGQQVASLRAVLILVQSIAGDTDAAPAEEMLLEEAAQFSAAYEAAAPIAQRRFDAQAGEIAAWAAAGVEALLKAGDPPLAPAARLAAEMEHGLARLRRVMGLD
jgi:subtilisin family serine protease